MAVKYFDDRQHDLDALQRLQEHALASPALRLRIKQMRSNLKEGLAYEAKVARVIDALIGDSPDWWVIHDLRLEHEGWAAQIDHLLINRNLEVFLLESKHFAEGLAVNAEGEFLTFVKGVPAGIPSPFEQNRRHLAILREVLHDNALHPRSWLNLQLPLKYYCWVLVPNNIRVTLEQPKSLPGTLFKLNQLAAQLRLPTCKPQQVNSLRRRLCDLFYRVSTRAIRLLVPQSKQAQFVSRILALHKPARRNWAGIFKLPEPLD